MVKNLYVNAGDTGLIPGPGRSAGVGNGSPEFLPGKFHGQRNLDTTEHRLWNSLCSCHFLISSLLLSPYLFCPLSCPSLHEIFPDISNFLKEISSLSHSVVFLYFSGLFT